MLRWLRIAKAGIGANYSIHPFAWGPRPPSKLLWHLHTCWAAVYEVGVFVLVHQMIVPSTPLTSKFLYSTSRSKIKREQGRWEPWIWGPCRGVGASALAPSADQLWPQYVDVSMSTSILMMAAPVLLSLFGSNSLWILAPSLTITLQMLISPCDGPSFFPPITSIFSFSYCPWDGTISQGDPQVSIFPSLPFPWWQ